MTATQHLLGPPTLCNILSQCGMFKSLCSNLDIGDLITLRRNSPKSLTGFFTTFSKMRWNVDERLKWFVDEPTELRSLLRRCNGIITGSFVIQFLDDVLWEDSDLNIYVQRGRGLKALCKHLCGKEKHINQSTGPPGAVSS